MFCNIFQMRDAQRQCLLGSLGHWLSKWGLQIIARRFIKKITKYKLVLCGEKKLQIKYQSNPNLLITLACITLDK